MGILEDIKKMQEEGRSEDEIAGALQEQGLQITEITNALAQTKIKQAISAPSVIDEPTSERVIKNQGMQPSVMETENGQQEQQPAEQPAAPTPPEQEYAQAVQQAYQQPPTQGYPTTTYDSYGYGMNADTISEIAEQVLFEKINPLKNKIESLLDMKTLIDSKINYMDERLKRIEQVIDRLQLSVLQKVGDYITSVDDIKKEVIETQKSFKSLLSNRSSTTPKQKEAKEFE